MRSDPRREKDFRNIYRSIRIRISAEYHISRLGNLGCGQSAIAAARRHWSIISKTHSRLKNQIKHEAINILLLSLGKWFISLRDTIRVLAGTIRA
jgi:hypothetical protein